MKTKKIKRIIGFAMPLTAMSMLFSLLGTVNVKAIETIDLKPKSSIIINQEQNYGRLTPQPDNLPSTDPNNKFVLDEKKLDQSLASELKYETRDFVDDYARVIGSYPVISGMQDLSNEIRQDIDSAVASLNLSIDEEIYDQIVMFSVDQKPGYARVSVVVSNPRDNFNTNLNYYLDLVQNKRISEDEYLKADENNSENHDDKADVTRGDTTSQDHDTIPGAKRAQEITMVPLRVNAEMAGWKVDWEQKKSQGLLKATLSKDNTKIKTVFKENLDYDMIVKRGPAMDFLRTGELDEYADLLGVRVEWSGDSKLNLYQGDKLVRVIIVDSLDCDLMINQTSAEELFSTGLFDKYVKHLGWEVNWDRSSVEQQDCSKAILSKDNRRIKILVDAGLDYDLIINEDSTQDVVKTEKLDKPAELQDDTLYVPSSFINKYLASEPTNENTKANGESKKEIISSSDVSSTSKQSERNF